MYANGLAPLPECGLLSGVRELSIVSVVVVVVVVVF